MKKINFQNLMVGSSLAAIILLFGSFLFQRSIGAIIAAVACLILGAVAVASAGALLVRVLARHKMQNPAVIRKRLTSCVAMLCAIALLVSGNPVAFAAEAAAQEESDLLVHLREEIAAYMEANKISVGMTDEELLDAFFCLDDEGCEAALADAEALLEEAEALSAREAKALSKEANTELCMRYYTVISELSAPTLFAVNDPVFTPIEGVRVQITNTTDTNSQPASDSFNNETKVVTVCVRSYKTTEKQGCDSVDVTKQVTDTVTITNTSGAEANISFDLGAEGGATATDTNGATISSVRQTMAPGATYTVKVTSSTDSTDNGYVYLKNFAYEELQDSYEITVVFPEGGNVSAAGEPVQSGHVANVTEDGIVLSANATNFKAWIDAQNNVLSYEPEFKFTPAVATTVRPVYMNVGLYQVGVKIFDDFVAALDYSAASVDKVVALLNNATLEAGNYTIPTGVTFLVPYDVNNTVRSRPADDPLTMQESIPGISTQSEAERPQKLFREFTLESGVNITVNGQLQVGGLSGRESHGVVGDYGQITMNAGSSITVEANAILSVWGYMKGSGTLEIKSQATVYENLLMRDYAGDALKMSTQNSRGAFPVESYDLISIAVPMTFYTGAKLKGFVSIWGTNIQYNRVIVDVIGTTEKNMMEMDNGTINVSILGPRTEIHVNGDAALHALVIDITITIVVVPYHVSIDSNKTGLPVPANWEFYFDSGKASTNTLHLMAGTKMVIGAGAELEIPEGKGIYLLDADKDLSSVTDDAALIVDGTLTVNGILAATEGDVHVTTTGGGKIVYNADWKETTFKTKNGVENAESHTAVPVKLKNTGNTLVDTAGTKAGTTFTHCASHDVWYDVRCEGCFVHDHVFDGEYVSDGIQHGKKCTVTGCEVVGAMENCAGGTATCNAKALCATCQNPYGEVDLTNHAGGTETVDAIEATCKVDGFTEGVKCLGCGNIISGHTSLGLDTNNHKTTAKIPAVDPGCETEGLTEGTKCTDCERVLVPQNVVGALGHSAGAEATCTTAQTCTVCGAELQAALGHAYGDLVEAQAEVHTQTELKGSVAAYYQCSVCFEYFDEAKNLTNMDALIAEAPTHTYSDFITTDDEKHWKECTVCFLKIEEAAHNVVTDKAVAPDFDNTGLTEGSHCDVCNKVLVAQVTLDKLTAVAKVGEQRYESLPEAVAAATAGETVLLLENTQLTERLTIGANITLDLNGKTVSAAFVDDFGTIYIRPGVQLTVTGNGIITNEADIVFANYGHLIIENGTFNSTGEYSATVYNMYNTADVYGTAEIKGGTFNAEIWNSGYLTVEGGTLNGLDNSGKTTITGGTINGAIYGGDGSDAPDLADKGTIAISGGQFQNRVEDESWFAAGYGHYDTVNDAGYYGVHQHSYSDFITTDAEKHWKECAVCFHKIEEAAHNVIIDQAVAPDFDNSGLTEGSHCDVCNKVLVAQVTLDKLTAVAKIGEQRYESLPEAVAAATAGETVLLLENTQLTGRLTIGANITLDLNGKTVSAAFVDDFGTIYIRPGVQLTVTGNGIITNEADIVFANYGHLIIENGTFNSTGEYSATVYNMYNTADVYGTAEIKGGTFNAEIWNSGYLTVEGGTLNGLDNSGKTTITGGTINGVIYGGDGSDAPDLADKGTIAISGGQFQNRVEDESWFAAGYGHYDTVNDAEYYGVHRHNYTSVVTDPTCTKIGYTTYTCSACSNRYTANEVSALGHTDEDGNYKCEVCEQPTEDAYAEINGIYYTSVEAALTAADAGDTVVMLQDSNESGKFLVIFKGLEKEDKNVTLDLNGFKLTAAGLAAIKGNHVVDNSPNATGALIIPKNNLSLQADNEELPFWIDGYYMFIKPKMHQQELDGKGTDSFLLSYKPVFKDSQNDDINVTSYMLDGAADNGIKIYLQLHWNEGEHEFDYLVYVPEDLIKVVYYGWDANGERKNLFKVTVSGVEGLNLSMNVVVKSDAGVLFEGDDLSYPATPAGTAG